KSHPNESKVDVVGGGEGVRVAISSGEETQVWQNYLNYPGSSALAITLKATPAQTHFKREQFLVCRVTSRYNHRFSDRTSIPHMKASPEILQPQFYNTGKVVITTCFKV